MFTPVQFSQLVAAAWFGPAAARFATIEHYTSINGNHQATRYRASYLPGVPGEAGCYQVSEPCPFAAVAATLHKAFEARALTFAQYAQGIWAVAQAEQVFTAAAPAELAPLAPLAPCPGCGERAEVAVFGLCACEYVRA